MIIKMLTALTGNFKQSCYVLHVELSKAKHVVTKIHWWSMQTISIWELKELYLKDIAKIWKSSFTQQNFGVNKDIR